MAVVHVSGPPCSGAALVRRLVLACGVEVHDDPGPPATPVVLAVRRPDAAVAALQGGRPEWRQHVAALAETIRGRRVLAIDHDRLIEDPRGQSARLLAWLDDADAGAPPHRLDGDPRAWIAPPPGTTPRVPVSDADWAAYAALLEGGGRGLDEAVASWRDERLTERYQALLEERRRDLERALAAKDRQLLDVEHRLAQIENRAARAEEAVAQLTREREHLGNLLTLAEREVRSLKHSWSYRVGRVVVAPGSLAKWVVRRLPAPPPTPIATQGDAPQRYAALASRPLVSIVMPVFDPPPEALRAALGSVTAQVYREWELCIADDASTRPEVGAILREIEAAHPGKVRVTRLPRNAGIGAASAAAADLARGEFLAFLDHDDELTEDALLEMACRLEAVPDADLVYSDEDKIAPGGAHVQAFHKPDFSPELLLSSNYICHLTVVRAALYREVGGFRPGYDGSQDYDLFLRLTEAARRVEHVPRVLYHWRIGPGSAAGDAAAKGGHWRESSRAALRAAIDRRGWDATVEDGRVPGTYRVRFAVPPERRVAIVILTTDRLDLLRRCVETVCATVAPERCEILVVAHRCVAPETFRFLEDERRAGRLTFVRDDGPFSFARLNNRAAAMTTAPFLLFLNNDVEALEAGWLEAMLEHAQRDDVGLVGAKLLYADRTVQHAGLALGVLGVAGHIHRGIPADHPGYFGWASVVRNCSAVTGACLMARRDVFDRLGGFDAELAVAFNDVDLGLRAVAAGWRVVQTPYATLVHHESASRGRDENPDHSERFAREIATMVGRWRDRMAADPFYNPNLTLWSEDVTPRRPGEDERLRAFLDRWGSVAGAPAPAPRAAPEAAGDPRARALAIFERWSTSFTARERRFGPADAAVSDRDSRIAAWNALVPLAGKRILELGPHEGGQTKQMIELGAAAVTAVEADPDAYLKCCLVKNEFGLDRARVVLGDIDAVLDGSTALDGPYDVCCASAILYHLADPVRTVDRIAALAPVVFVWSFVASERGPSGAWIEIVDRDGRTYRGRRVPQSPASPGSRVHREAVWLADPDLVQVFVDRGYEILGLERLDPAEGRLLSFVARRRDAAGAVPEAAEAPAAAAPSRHDYKRTWQALARDEHDARMHVQGAVEDEAILQAGRATLAVLERTVGARPDDVILEVGCGVGRVGALLAPRCREWVGCDVSARMLRHAARRLEPFANVRLVEISGYDLAPIPDASVDVVYCTVVFMHLDEWDRYQYVLEAQRVLRPGGRIYIDNFDLASPEGWEVFERHRAIPPERRPAHISKSSTREELEVYLRRAGFADLRSEADGLWVRAWGRRA